MTAFKVWLIIITGFMVVCLASKRIGELFSHINLPRISGFLFSGIITGPYLLGIISESAVDRLRFVDEIALAFIAYAAGSELFVRQLKKQLKGIRYTTFGLVVATFSFGSAAFFLLSEHISFTKDMPPTHRAAVAILTGAILVARSPSSAIAVVNELRAKGPFTRTVLGVTVIMDAVVITLFSICVSIAGTVLLGDHFDLDFLMFLFLELFSSLLLGYLLSKLLRIILSLGIHRNLKTLFILSTGYAVFISSNLIRSVTQAYWNLDILLEPMLICMLASFLVTNYSQYRTELMKVLHDIAPVVYVAFFTLTGASLKLNVLAYTWTIALTLFGVRIIAIFLGSFFGGMLAKEPMKNNRIAWMSYITQAGVGLGLAKEVVVEFPQWGATFATIIIAVIILNQIMGPPFFKWALYLAKEAHHHPDGQHSDAIRDAVIFGLESDSLALARLLQSHGWQVRIAAKQADYIEKMGDDAELEIYSISDIDIYTLNRLGVGHANAIVAMMMDDENYKICELADEHFGIHNVIVRLHQRALFKRFHEIGAVVVEPSTAIVNLLDQFVRSPSAATLLLGMEKGRDIIEFELRNSDLNNVAIRDLHLPLDIQIISIRRRGEFVICGGFTHLTLGDWITVVGSRPSLEQIMLHFGENREQALVQFVEQATPKEISSISLKKEVKVLIQQNNDQRALRFNQLIKEGVVLDIEDAMDYKIFFRVVAETLSPKMDLQVEMLFTSLMEREAESSTALRPDLAVPHIIIEGVNSFSILLARSRKGIYFSELAPKVHAVFVLIGTRDERNYHLYVLSTIAKLVQRPHFREKWLRAKTQTTLRNIARITDI